MYVQVFPFIGTTFFFFSFSLSSLRFLKKPSQSLYGIIVHEGRGGGKTELLTL
jgi:hypothetical protein